MTKPTPNRLGQLFFGLLGSIGVLAGTNVLGANVTVEQLEAAGFHCEVIGEHPHCINERSIGGQALQVLVFSGDREFLGTETLLLAGTYENGRPPCPPDNLEEWLNLGGLGYYACHHFLFSG